MNTPMRVLLDVAFRSVALLVLSEAIAALYAAANPTDDVLGTGLTAMFALVCAAASWGLWDGSAAVQYGRVTWVVTGLVVSLGQALYSHLRFGEWSWSELANDMSSGLVFLAGLIYLFRRSASASCSRRGATAPTSPSLLSEKGTE